MPQTCPRRGPGRESPGPLTCPTLFCPSPIKIQGPPPPNSASCSFNQIRRILQSPILDLCSLEVIESLLILSSFLFLSGLHQLLSFGVEHHPLPSSLLRSCHLLFNTLSPTPHLPLPIMKGTRLKGEPVPVQRLFAHPVAILMHADCRPKLSFSSVASAPVCALW